METYRHSTTEEGGSAFSPGGEKMLIQKSERKKSVNALDEWLPPNTSVQGLWEQTQAVIAEPALIFKADGTLFWANPASLSFFGVDAGELLGRHCYEMVRRFGLRFSDCPYERILKSRRRESGMMEYNGTWHTNRLDPVVGADGDLQGFVSRILDAGDSARLQEATEQLNHLMTATDNAVVMTGPDHRILRWNAGVERVFGYRADDLEGTVIHDLISPTSRKMFAMYADRVIHGGGMQQFLMESLTKSGEVVSVAVSMAPLHDPGGAVSGMVTLSRDVTGEHAVDMRLVRHMADTAVKITGPLSHMRSNLEDTVTALQDGLLTTEELVMIMTVLMKSIGHIEENLGEMNRIAIDGIDGVPDAMRKYLSR
ncbi:PAS domain-containing protein [Methanogenium sp. S4BF]|uniref:PAS domain-containing protein n=1 Tax=Methanogenium sp. S4BF TaxID=1789226 RepID=UPI002416E017|nr:PAS domain-containing protein [Methanogenium sp. S4BF]WFN33673.1 PAS domain-containing protein [Methanogenium sp. S4BF]